MKKIIALIAIVWTLGKSSFAQENLAPNDFQTYSMALYLARHQTVKQKDTVHFLLDKKWMNQVVHYLSDLKKETDSIQYQHTYHRLKFPPMENLGITVHFYAKIGAKAWLQTPAVQKFIKNTQADINFLPSVWDGYSSSHVDSSVLVIKSDKYINWFVVMKWFEQSYNLDLRKYGRPYMRILDNPVWEEYEPRDCADKCQNYIFYRDYNNTDNIILGYHYRNKNNWSGDGWTWNYSLKTRKFQKTEFKNEH